MNNSKPRLVLPIKNWLEAKGEEDRARHEHQIVCDRLHEAEREVKQAESAIRKELEEAGVIPSGRAFQCVVIHQGRACLIRDSYSFSEPQIELIELQGD